MADVFYTKAPHWEWWIVAYFFLGGIAGGAAFLAAMLDLFGDQRDRRLSNIAHLVVAPLVAICGVLLIVDLNRPERFWHMLIQSETYRPMFKWWSPISFGAWGIGLFGLVSGLAFVGVLAERGVLPRALRTLREGTLGRIVSALTGLFGLFVAAYTGMLLADTNRPLWGNTTLLGVLFLVSGVSAASALLMLLGERRADPSSVAWLTRMDIGSLLLEGALLVVLVLSLGSIANDVLGNGWGLLLALGTGVAGILIPLALHFRPRLLGSLTVPSAAVLGLVGGFVLRTVILLASERA